VTENDCIFNSREPILHLMRGEWNAADELVRIKLRAYHGGLFHVAVNLSPSRLAAIVTTVRNVDGVTICRYGAAIQEWLLWTNGWIDAISLEAWAWRQQ
jgi:hypothetical protein